MAGRSGGSLASQEPSFFSPRSFSKHQTYPAVSHPVTPNFHTSQLPFLQAHARFLWYQFLAHHQYIESLLSLSSLHRLLIIAPLRLSPVRVPLLSLLFPVRRLRLVVRMRRWPVLVALAMVW